MGIDRSVWMACAGYVLTGLSALFFVLDATIKLLQLPVVLETTTHLGWPASSVVSLGIILLGGTALYVWPRTNIMGAIILTAYLGGTVAAHARIGSPLLTHTLFGVYVGLLMWGGIYLRDTSLRNIFPFRRSRPAL